MATMAATEVESQSSAAEDAQQAEQAAAGNGTTAERVYENVQILISEGIDLGKSVKLGGFALAGLDDWKASVKEVIQSKFDVLPESIDSLRLCVNASGDKDIVITFGSPLHAKRVCTENKPDETKFTLEMLSSDDKPGGEFIVSDEIGDDSDQKGGTWLNLADNDSAHNGADEPAAGEKAADGGDDAAKIVDEPKVNGEHVGEANAAAAGADDSKGDDGAGDEHEHEAETHETGSGKGEKKKRDEIKYEVVWEGAPEFQWRTCNTPEDRNKLVIENVSLGELSDPFIYQAVQRAVTVDFFCNVQSQGNYRGPQPNVVENNTLRRGRLTLTYSADVKAMTQAMNCLVYFRSRANKRLKVFLPQTPGTVRMKSTLESRLGRVIEPFGKFKQLLVRGVADTVDEDKVRAAFVTFADKIDAIEFVNDHFERRCALLSFGSAATAALVHTRYDEVKLAADDKYAKVFFMHDMVGAPRYMHFVEQKQLLREKRRELKSSGGGQQQQHKAAATAAAGTGAGDSVASKPADAGAKAEQVGAGAGGDAAAAKSLAKSDSEGGAKPNAAKATAGAGAPQQGAKRKAAIGQGAAGPPVKQSRAGAAIHKSFPAKYRGGPASRINMRGMVARGPFRGAIRGSRGGPISRPPPPHGPRYLEPRDERGPWGGRPPYDSGGMQAAAALVEHTRQLEMQQQIMRQQEMISELASELRTTRGGAGGGGGGGGYGVDNRAGGQHTLASGSYSEVGSYGDQRQYAAAADTRAYGAEPAVYSTDQRAFAPQRQYGAGGGGYMGYTR